MAEINVTPFVDVMLVLLVIFMVTAPMMQSGVEVDLPETKTQPMRMRDEPLILSVKKDGTLFVGRTEVPLDELAVKLEAIFEGRDTKELFLRADKDVPYGVVVAVMAEVKKAGIERLGMVTEPSEAR